MILHFCQSAYVELMHFFSSAYLEFRRKQLPKFTCPFGSFVCPRPSGNGICRALGFSSMGNSSEIHLKFKSLKELSVHSCFRSCPIILKFRTGHSSDVAIICAKSEVDRTTGILEERDFGRFEVKRDFGWISVSCLTTNPRVSCFAGQLLLSYPISSYPALSYLILYCYCNYIFLPWRAKVENRR